MFPGSFVSTSRKRRKHDGENGGGGEPPVSLQQMIAARSGLSPVAAVMDRISQMTKAQAARKSPGLAEAERRAAKMLEEAARVARSCKACGEDELVTDGGDVVCEACGVVGESGVIDDGVEYRTFADAEPEDNEAVKHYGEAFDKTLHHDLVGHGPMADAEIKVLRDGLDLIKNALCRIMPSDAESGTNTQALRRASYLFEMQHTFQECQKKCPLGHLGGEKIHQRKRFSLKKPMVVGCIWQALLEQRLVNDEGALFDPPAYDVGGLGVHRAITLAHVSSAVPGAPVSETSLRRVRIRLLEIEAGRFVIQDSK